MKTTLILATLCALIGVTYSRCGGGAPIIVIAKLMMAAQMDSPKADSPASSNAVFTDLRSGLGVNQQAPPAKEGLVDSKKVDHDSDSGDIRLKDAPADGIVTSEKTDKLDVNKSNDEKTATANSSGDATASETLPDHNCSEHVQSVEKLLQPQDFNALREAIRAPCPYRQRKDQAKNNEKLPKAAKRPRYLSRVHRD